MIQKFMVTARPWQRYLIGFITFLMVSLATLVFMLCIAAFMLTRIDTPDYILIPLTTVMLTVSSFLDAFLIGKVQKENGILIGLSIAGIFCMLITVVALHYKTFQLSSIFISKIAAVLFAGIAGGIAGVNT